ncbi:Hg(II)-responsive transcriptional regulator [Ureibacillus sp. MALMAid1270]|uniref:Hg(II)-responsive transcriptional regulator n=1 Tax=Ureibacillus sp. MALMAid1270 TaxID=3411629 RepID=UPI003BA7ACCA
MQLRIGELAEKCGVNKETIRYYERLGLILEPDRTENGYRMYSLQTVDRWKFIKRMQELGFTLNEIDKLLGVVDHNEVKCRDIYDFTVLKLEDIKRKIEDLKKIEQMLIDLKERCPENKNIYKCPIIGNFIGLKKENRRILIEKDKL